MPLIVPDAAEPVILQAYVRGATTAKPYRLRLFKNDYTPDASTVIGDLVEADFAGYASHVFVSSEWQTAIEVGGTAETHYDVVPIQWTNTGGAPQTIYGYWVENSAGDLCLWAERFATPIVVAPGGTMQTRPAFTARSEY